MVVLAIAGYAAIKMTSGGSDAISEVPEFASQVQLGPLDKTAVQADGRIRSFESHAKTYMGYISGPRSIRGQSNGFTYLDLMFRSSAYRNIDLIYVKHKGVRDQILAHLREHPDVNDTRADTIRKSGLIARNLLAHPPVRSLLQELGKDLIRTSKQVDAIQSALSVSDPAFLLDNLRMVASPTGRIDTPWIPMRDLVSGSSTPADAMHAGMSSTKPVPGLDHTFQENMATLWTNLQASWQQQDASAVNEHIAALAALVPTISPQLYPASGRLAMESWYFRTKSMTWVWLIYLMSVIPLLMSIIYKWDGARKTGMVLFAIAFLFHTASVGVRWYISGRWPNSNMFEAVTTSAWFGGLGALILEYVVRRSAFRNLFALASAVMSMGALMAAYFLPAQLDSAINNKMAALNDVWLYIHTNMIIWSYAVIGLACVPALLFLRNRWCQAWDSRSVPKIRLLILPIALVILNYTAYRLLMHALDDPARELTRTGLLGTVGAFWGSLLILLMEVSAARARRLAGGSVDLGASGGASSLIFAGASDSSFIKPERPTTTQVYDGATMVLVELSFIMLWTGLVMGAIWADHSWGRPWGWDPKEVFALNTFIIFLILIHVRLKVRDKAFWTAVLAIVGFEVMMFNWIVVNFIITGLHSYA